MRRRRWPWLVLIVLLGLAALVAWFPAAWAWNLARARVPQLQMQAVHGSIWNGRADQVAYAGVPLGQVDWTLSRAALAGRLRLMLRVDGPLVSGQGRVHREGKDRLVGQHLEFTVHVDQLPVSVGTPGLRPGGELDMAISHVVIVDQWPRQLHGRVLWRHATLADGDGPVALGTLHASLHDRAGTLLEARLGDAGDGPLALSGQAEISALGWKVDARLQPRSNQARLRSILAHLGEADAEGVVHVQRHGGIAMGSKP